MLGVGEVERSRFSRYLPAWMKSSWGDAPNPSQEIIAASAPSYRRNITYAPEGRCRAVPRRTANPFTLPTKGAGSAERGLMERRV
jgi:hypothetical protein